MEVQARIWPRWESSFESIVRPKTLRFVRELVHFFNRQFRVYVYDKSKKRKETWKKQYEVVKWWPSLLWYVNMFYKMLLKK